MNVKRGFFRLWIGVSLCWIIGLGWYLRNDLHIEGPWTLSSAPLDCAKEMPTENTRAPAKLTDKQLECATAAMQAQSWVERSNAAVIIFVPPMGLFIFGSCIVWIIQGLIPKS